jgi:hypothetical protein
VNSDSTSREKQQAQRMLFKQAIHVMFNSFTSIKSEVPATWSTKIYSLRSLQSLLLSWMQILLPTSMLFHQIIILTMNFIICFFHLALFVGVACGLPSPAELLPIVDLGYALHQATVNVCFVCDILCFIPRTRLIFERALEFRGHLLQLQQH